MSSAGFLAKGHIVFWLKKNLKNSSKSQGDISEQSVVRTEFVSAIIIIISLFQEDNMFGTNASLIYGP